MVKNPAADAGDTGEAGSIPGSGRSPGRGNSNPLQYSWLENSTDRGAWQSAVQSKGSKTAGHDRATEHTHTHRLHNLSKLREQVSVRASLGPRSS